MGKTIKYSELVSPAYREFFNSKKTYVVCKGSRGSGKSKAAALWIILNMMKYSLANTLCIRQVAGTLRDSVFSDLQWAISRLGVEHLWKCTTSPLEITYKPTGQKILFRGMDDGLKITSISVPVGVLCWCLVEEAYQILKEDDFNILDESIRGQMPEGYFKRMMLIFNPWSERHWLKRRFFDIPLDNVLAMTTTYKDNPWLSETDIAMYEDIRRRSPARARVACDGDWGISEGLIFDNWRVEDLSKQIPQFDNIKCAFDPGWNDPTAILKLHYDRKRKIIYVFDEVYKQHMRDEEILEACRRVVGKNYLMCDSADPRTIDYLALNGINAVPVKKGEDSIMRGIRWLQGCEIVIDIKCQNFINEISQLCFEEDKYGNVIDRPASGNDHLANDCLRYALEMEIIGAEIKSGKRL